jgi:tRNA 2-selenouridine synthase
MPDYVIDISDFLKKVRVIPVFDVRSPAEFEHGHIPGAINLPLFTNEERSVIGTLYLKRGSSEATLKGLEMIGPKLKEFVKFAINNAPSGETLIHCWRGGMRSNSMAWLLNTAGIRSYALEGGYKAYRRHVHQTMEKPLRLIVITGMTGSGKTVVLEELEKMGHQIIHLERLACHKGSAFGSIGMPLQPTTEQYENDLFETISRLNPEEPVFIEDESISIGSVFIPKPFFLQMSSAPCIRINLPLQQRIGRLIEDYTQTDNNLLIQGVVRIRKHLGLENAENIIHCINNHDMEGAIALILKYYDKLYTRSMNLSRHGKCVEINADSKSLNEIAGNIVDLTTHN